MKLSFDWFSNTIVLLLFVHMCGATMHGQVNPPTGIRHNPPSVHVFNNGKIIVAPGTVIEKGTIVIRDGVITAVGENVSIPPDARVWDMSGMTIYPGFIDSYSDFGVPKKPRQSFGGNSDTQQKPPDQTRGPKHWNERVRSSQNADEIFSSDQKSAEKLRGLGFTTALVVPQNGIFRGTSSLINLGDEEVNNLLLKTHIAQHISFDYSFGEGYPNSLMGAVALIRQTILDARWFHNAMEAWAKYPNEPKPEYVADLAALDNFIALKQPAVFETGDEFAILRAAAIAKEFHLPYLVRGNGYEYRRLDAIKSLAVPIVLPVNFPDPPAVQTPEEALNVSLEDLRHWNDAPENPKALYKAGVSFALTTDGLKDVSNFLPNVRKSVQRGLPEDAALAAMTIIPAKLWGVEKILGTITSGKIANIVVADGNIFNEKTKIRETWVQGKRYEVKPKIEVDPRGTWKLSLSSQSPDSLRLILNGEPDGLTGSMKAKGKDVKLSTVTFSDRRLALSFPGDSIGMSGVIRMTGVAVNDKLSGNGEFSDGKQFAWTAERLENFSPPKDTSKPKPQEFTMFIPTYPPGEFGREKLPAQPDHLFIRNATIWTCGTQGKLEGGDLLIEKGKIANIGKELICPPDAVIIDGKGKNVTPGLIDCHSHTGVAGSVNESGAAITAEVRIGDVLDPDDIALYRELAGGLTVANVLHGSANPIGGQNQVIKLRWGALPEEMKFAGAMPGIKFALGENPKGSNWGEHFTRYPQTREGVEEMIRDEFRAALDYEKSWKDYESGVKKIPPRRDLRTETVLEILKSKRLVHAHSYRQDEIEMLLRIAEEFGFRIGTLQHILEGYKVADLIGKHGAGASSFSDWWAYKLEVYDAIPYNGALMHDAGVIVSYNSDSDELARHLNTEAAKAIKYGGVSEQDALNMVTINPAKQLRIDNKVGSLDVGKDADFVIWSGNPLSNFSICEQTWIDGKKYFDRQEDKAMSEEIQKERASIIQKILAAPKGEGGGAKPSSPPREKIGYSCHEDVSGKEGR